MTEHDLEVALDILNDGGPEELLTWAWSVLELYSSRIARAEFVPNTHARWRPAESSASGTRPVSKSGTSGVIAATLGSDATAVCLSRSGAYWTTCGRSTSRATSRYSYDHARHFTQVFLEEELGRRVD
jgi:hypothetical protein